MVGVESNTCTHQWHTQLTNVVIPALLADPMVPLPLADAFLDGITASGVDTV